MSASVDLYCANKEENDAEGTAVRTDAQTPDEFLDAFAEAICDFYEIKHEPKRRGDQNDVPDKATALRTWMGQAFELFAKLKGYKADRVYEKRVLWTGDITPYHAWSVGEGGERADTAGYE